MNSNQNWHRCNAHTFWQQEAACSHVVQIYEHEKEFLNLLEGYVSGGFATGDAVVVIASPDHLAALETRLRASGSDPEVLKATDQYIPLDVNVTLAKFMVNDWPDYSLFMETISAIFSRARKDSRKVRAFGEMVAILWGKGNSGATIMLEQLWNMFCEKEPVTLLCAYAASAFAQEPAVSLQNICKTHSKMIAGAGNSSTELLYQNI